MHHLRVIYFISASDADESCAAAVTPTLKCGNDVVAAQPLKQKEDQWKMESLSAVTVTPQEGFIFRYIFHVVLVCDATSTLCS